MLGNCFNYTFALYCSMRLSLFNDDDDDDDDDDNGDDGDDD